ncbi:MAG: patatin-like phospholipase family protein, partial [Bacteroidales bacterium]
MAEKKYRTGLVLSGGGARGFAHIGVLQALNESGIYPDVISGTSAGALVGVLYADGYSPARIMKLMNSTSRFRYIRPTMPREGLLQISGIEQILRASLRAKRFEDLRIPLIVTATDLNYGKIEYFSKGDLLPVVIASASIPVIFKPVIINQKHYVDGGVLDNMPVKPIEHDCSLLIGSFVNPTGYQETVSSLVQIAERAFMLSMTRDLGEKAKKFDVFIAPLQLKDYKILDPEKAAEVYEIGYRETLKKLNEPEVAGLVET